MELLSKYSLRTNIKRAHDPVRVKLVTRSLSMALHLEIHFTIVDLNILT